MDFCPQREHRIPSESWRTLPSGPRVVPSTAVVVETIELTLRVPKSALTMLAPLPATVTQHTVEHHFGIPQRLYVQRAT